MCSRNRLREYNLTGCLLRAHRWDTTGSFSMRQAKVVVNLHCGRLHAEPCWYRASNRAKRLFAVICWLVLSSELIKSSVHRCPLRNEKFLYAFHCDVTTGVHMRMLATGGHFAYQQNSSDFFMRSVA